MKRKRTELTPSDIIKSDKHGILIRRIKGFQWHPDVCKERFILRSDAQNLYKMFQDTPQPSRDMLNKLESYADKTHLASIDALVQHEADRAMFLSLINQLYKTIPSIGDGFSVQRGDDGKCYIQFYSFSLSPVFVRGFLERNKVYMESFSCKDMIVTHIYPVSLSDA